MAPPDLTSARATAETLLVDACTITADPDGTDDDVLDPDTLELGPAVDDASEVYAGPCLIGHLTNRDRPMVVGGEQVTTDLLTLRLPHTAAPAPGNWVIIDEVHGGGDDTLVGEEFRILEVTKASLVVTRQAVMTASTRVPR